MQRAPQHRGRFDVYDDAESALSPDSGDEKAEKTMAAMATASSMRKGRFQVTGESLSRE